MAKTNYQNFMEGFRNGIPICMGYLSVAFAFGIFCINAGLGPWHALVISMTNVTSAGQLAGVPIITAGLPLIEMALTQLVINMRYALMSISISQKVDSSVTLFHRMVISFMNTDEIFAVASGHNGPVGKYYMYGLIITPYIGWSLGTILGAACGNILPYAVTNALGIAIYGMFIAIIVPVARQNMKVLMVIINAVLLSCMFAYIPAFEFISAGFAIIICSVVSAGIFAVIAPMKAKEEN